MKEKYYTPSIEEFHVGFEYEMLNPDYQGQSDGNEWKKAVCDKADLISTIQNWKHYQDYRVRYLSPEDIVSAGWGRGEENQYGIMFNKEGCRLWYTHLLVITIWRTLIEGGEERIVFQGQIKNLSTLRKVMECVGVK